MLLVRMEAITKRGWQKKRSSRKSSWNLIDQIRSKGGSQSLPASREEVILLGLTTERRGFDGPFNQILGKGKEGKKGGGNTEAGRPGTKHGKT